MDENRTTKKILNYSAKLKNTIGWMEEVRKDAQKLGISEESVQDREGFRKLIDNVTFPENKPVSSPKRVWTEEQSRAVGEKMKKYWDGRKKKN